MLTLPETVEPSIAATGPYWSQFASVPLQNPSFLQRSVQWHRSCSEAVGAMPMTSRANTLQKTILVQGDTSANPMSRRR